MVEERPHILLLGGTGEAYALAGILVDRKDLRLTTSLAGATARPRMPAGTHRIGGFGGAAGLEAWLAKEEVALVLDASHPFASRISLQARAAAEATGIPCLRLERPPWRAGPGDDWRHVLDLDTGLEALAGMARLVLAAVGTRAVGRLAGAPFDFVVRGIDPPSSLPRNVTFIRDRGPFALEDERRLLETRRIDAVLCRNSGGEGARAKLDAARERGLPVVMIERPQAMPADAVPDVASALRVLDQRFLGRSTWV